MDGEQTVELHGDELGVHHLVLGRTGMDVPAVEHHLGSGGVEVLVLQFTQGAAVGSVGKFGPEVLEVEPICPPADLFIGGKADAQSGMGLRGGQEAFGCGEDFRNPGLVVGPQERGAVGDNEVLAPVLGEAGEVRFLHHNVLGLV